jgi:hypothetical protein
VSETWRSIQKLAELEPAVGMLMAGSVPAVPNTPWDMLKGAGNVPDWSENAENGPLAIPAAYGSPEPYWLFVTGKLPVKPVQAL